MYYTLQITASPDRETSPVRHRPSSIETFAGKGENVTDEEIDMVAEAFKQQIKQLLVAMVRNR